MKIIKMILFGSALAVCNAAYSEPHYYRYKDTDGKLVITNTMPADKARLGYEMIDSNGRVLKKFEGELTAEDIENLKKKQKEMMTEKQRNQQQREYDLSLMRRYSFVTDIEAEKKRKIEELKATLSIVSGNLHGVRGDLETEYARAANFERQGKRLPDDIKKRIAEIEKSVSSTEELYKQREKELQKTTDDYDKAIQRFKEIQIRRGRVSPTP